VQNQVEINKIGKKPLHEFYYDSYYMTIYNKTNYYPVDNFYIYENGFNDNIFYFEVTKNSNVIQNANHKRDFKRELTLYDVD
jgi:hypothetical protein